MRVNFFFNEFCYDQIYDYIDNNDENYLINGIFLTKIEKTSHDFKTIINDNSNEENELLRQNKKYFDDTIRHEFPKLFIDNIPKNLNLDKSISYPIERLLFHHNNTNFDLNIFFSKNFTNLKNKKINIFYGGEYRLTESLTFLYFLFLIYNLKNNDLNIFYKDRKSALEKYLSIENFLNKKIISNQHIENNSKFEKKFSKNLIWIEGLRQREYWINNLKPLILGCSSNGLIALDKMLSPAISLYCFWISPPTRVPEPAAITRAKTLTCFSDVINLFTWLGFLSGSYQFWI